MRNDAIAVLNNIVRSLYDGDLSMITRDNVVLINNLAMEILSCDSISEVEKAAMGIIVQISNILYNNTDREVLPLEDGVYDLLLELYKTYNPNYEIGAYPIRFNDNNTGFIKEEDNDPITPAVFIDRGNEDFFDNSIFVEDLRKVPEMTLQDYAIRPAIFREDITKRTINTPHMYPELVGTLDKCKFVTNHEAAERGVLEDSNVAVFERDFLQKHMQMGIITPEEKFHMVLELKYDGISVEADVTNNILSARSRGDTANDVATDLTPILKRYNFPHCPYIPENEAFGMKFEAVISKFNLERLMQISGKEYANCRNAIIGIFSSSDAYKYIDLITLVPLATSLDIGRIEEIEFMNKYYQNGEYLRYAIIYGNYQSILFQVKRFVEEAEFLRPYMPFMYDGVVVSYIDPVKIKALGRENSVNKYSIAIKFNAMKKQTTFIGYDYTVGQNGNITPMIHYNPVEFYGTIHNKSTGHSYARFLELGLREGDIINVEYTNDVMPYVTKPYNSANDNNTNPVIPFITECPSCGNKLKISDSGKTVYCDNFSCPARNIARMTNMLQKLNLKDFSEESLKAVARFSLSELFSLTEKDVRVLGPNSSKLFIERLNEIKTKPIYDYKIVGALGFTGIAIEKWKVIFKEIPLDYIIWLPAEELYTRLVSIKGIGPGAANTITNEREFFMNDLLTISRMTNVIPSKGISSGKSVRFSGVRDKELVDLLNERGMDANGDTGVTKTTDILIIPYAGFTSAKVKSAGPNTLVIPIDEFKANIDVYCAD